MFFSEVAASSMSQYANMALYTNIVVPDILDKSFLVLFASRIIYMQTSWPMA
jgi:hypothetical protein